MSKILIAIGFMLVLALGAWKLHVFRRTATINQSGNPFAVSSTIANNQGSGQAVVPKTTVPQNAGGGPGETLSLSLAYAGVSRTYLLHVPGGYTASQQYPLLLVFHGNGGTGAGVERMSGFDAVADAHGFIVAYPDSNSQYKTGGQWQLAGTDNDVTFMEELMRAIEAKYRIDETRVYVAGFSEGGGIAAALACEDTAHLAGFADISTDMSTTFMRLCKPSVPITTVYFHGTADPVSPYNGGTSGGYATIQTNSAQDTAQFWARANNCSATPATTQLADTLSTGANVTDSVSTWTGCAGGMSVTLYTIEGGGHAWPGDPSYSGKFGPASGLNASEIIWNTLSQSHR